MLGRFLSQLTTAELEVLKEQLNLTETEEKVFDCLSKGKSNVETSMKCNVSLATVGNRVADIKHKIERVERR